MNNRDRKYDSSYRILFVRNRGSEVVDLTRDAFLLIVKKKNQEYCKKKSPTQLRARIRTVNALAERNCVPAGFPRTRQKAKLRSHAERFFFEHARARARAVASGIDDLPAAELRGYQGRQQHKRSPTCPSSRGREKGLGGAGVGGSQLGELLLDNRNERFPEHVPNEFTRTDRSPFGRVPSSRGLYEGLGFLRILS